MKYTALGRIEITPLRWIPWTFPSRCSFTTNTQCMIIDGLGLLCDESHRLSDLLIAMVLGGEEQEIKKGEEELIPR
jgi:hypothetical protein